MRARARAALVVLCVTVACTQEVQRTPPPTPIVSPAPAASADRVSADRQLTLPPPPSPAPPSAPRHDLSVDERRGGHTLERHVGRTDEQLRERLQREPNISAASTYEDRVTAETVVTHAFAESADELERWSARTGRRPNLVLERTEPAPIGRSLRRGQRSVSLCDRAVVVLRWDDRARASYVLTSYPECRR